MYIIVAMTRVILHMKWLRLSGYSLNNVVHLCINLYFNHIKPMTEVYAAR